MKLFVATPIFERVHPVYVRSLVEASRKILAESDRNAIGWSSIECAWTVGAPVERARQDLFESFLRSDAHHLLMIDGDIGFEPDLPLRMLKRKEDLISAAVPVRSLDVEEAANTGVATEALFFAGETGFKCKVHGLGVEHEGDWFMESTLGSTALMLLSRAGAERMDREHPGGAFLDPVIEKDLAMGEDLSFFTRWQALGGSIWVLLSSTVSHSGPVTIQGNYSRAISEADHPKIVRSWPYEERALPGDLP